MVSERPLRPDHEHPQPFPVFGLTVGHDVGLAAVYSAAMTGWGFVAVSSLLDVLGVRPDLAQHIGLGGAAVLGWATWTTVSRFDKREDKDPRSA